MSTPNNPFEQIIIPTAPSAWPPAPIYWLILAIVIGAIVLTVFLVKRHIKKRKVIKQALASLQHLQNNAASFAELNQLLKGLSLQYYPRPHVASLTGEAWFIFINKHSQRSSTPLFDDLNEFNQRLYQQSTLCTEQDYANAKIWIQQFPKQVITLQKSLLKDQKNTGKNDV